MFNENDDPFSKNDEDVLSNQEQLIEPSDEFEESFEDSEKPSFFSKVNSFFKKHLSFDKEIEIGGKEILALFIVFLILALVLYYYFFGFNFQPVELNLLIKVDKKEGFAPLTVNFNAEESIIKGINVKRIEFDFKDGSKADSLKVKHVFSKPGNYDVELKAYDDKDQVYVSSVLIKVKDKLKENKKPIALIKMNPLIPKEQQEITFDASKSYDFDGHVVSYSWSFNDGFSSTEKIIKRRLEAGDYSVTLKVKDNLNVEGSVSINFKVKPVSNVHPSMPVANFSFSPFSPVVSETVVFDASCGNSSNPCSYDSNGSIVSYSWSFGDNSTGTGMTANHAYSSEGTYHVTLTVISNSSLHSTKEKSITVRSTVQENQPPTANFVYSPTNPRVNQTIQFNSSSFDSDGSIVSYSWSFGDGSTRTGSNVTHSYSSDGSYTVTLTVTDNDGLQDRKTRTIVVGEAQNQSPSADFSFSPNNPEPNQTVAFTSLSTDPDGRIASLEWFFSDDGSTASGLSVSHSFSSEGTYNVTLTVTDNNGASDSITRQVIVSLPQQNHSPDADFSFSPRNPIVGESVTFDASSSSDPDNDPLLYVWDFGDDSAESYSVIQDHSYSSADTYTVTLTVTDDGGLTDTSSQVITVSSASTNQPPVASFSFSPDPAKSGCNTSFTSSSSDPDPNDHIASYYWDFKDGFISTVQNPNHTFNNTGTYDVNLTVTDNAGLPGSAQNTVSVVDNSSPVAVIDSPADNYNAQPGESVNFNACSSYDPDGSDDIASQYWEFSWNSLSYYNCSKDYTVPTADGSYTATFKIRDKCGVTTEKSITINVGSGTPPNAQFIVIASHPIEVGDSLLFDAHGSTDDGTIDSYDWDFGDGSTGSGVSVNHSYSAADNYTVTLTVTDDDGLTDSISKQITVSSTPQPPVAVVDVFPDNVPDYLYHNDLTICASNSYDPDGGAIASAEITGSNVPWAFTAPTTIGGGCTSGIPERPGNYYIDVTVTDDEGQTNTTRKNFTAIPATEGDEMPHGVFSCSPRTISVGGTVYCDASSSYDPDGTVEGYFWIVMNHPDPSIFDEETRVVSGGQTNSFTFTHSGQWAIMLEVVDNDGVVSQLHGSVITVNP